MMRIRLGDWVAKSLLFRRRKTLLRRRRISHLQLPTCVEVLEARAMLAAPIAVNDSYSVLHDRANSPMTGVLQNDSSNGGPPTLTAVQNTGVSHGSLSLSSGGTFTYTPSAGYTGSDSFTYKAYNGTEYSSAATVSLTVTNTAPTAANDSYTINKDVFSSSAEAVNSLKFNDSDADADTLTTSLVTGPTNGSVTVNSTGTFTYTPTLGYVGSDSFTYAASDGIASSNATVSLTVQPAFGAQVNGVDQPFGGVTSQGAFDASGLTGETRATADLGHAHELLYNSLTAERKPIVAVETNWIGSGIMNPSTIEIQTTLGGVAATTIWYSGGMLQSNALMRLAAQVDAGSLATGHYVWEMKVIAHFSTTNSTRIFTGYQEVVNRSASEFGPGWNLSELDRLHSGTGGMLWVGGAGGTAWFTDTGSGTYSSPAGPLAFHTLVKNANNTYTLTDKFGNKENFSTIGLLTSRVDVNGNTTTYAYTDANSDGQTVELSTITDPFSRVATFNYTSGKVSSVVDVAGRTTTLGRDGSSRITTITQPDPDGAGALAAPVTTYAYDSSNRMTSVTDPLNHATALTYGFTGRLSQAVFADTNHRDYTPSQIRGVVNTAGGYGTSSGSAATLYLVGFTDMAYTNELGFTSKTQYDRFGNVLSYTDPLSNVTSWQYNTNGLVTQMTGADPDGGGSLSASVTSAQYDSKGNLTRITYADNSYETWTYSSTLNVPLTHVDLRGKTTTYTVDPKGNRLTATDPLSNVTTWAYNSRGQITSVTGADPDAGGSLTSPVTTYTYDTTAVNIRPTRCVLDFDLGE